MCINENILLKISNIVSKKLGYVQNHPILLALYTDKNAVFH